MSCSNEVGEGLSSKDNTVGIIGITKLEERP
jgi:hypothetical protein